MRFGPSGTPSVVDVEYDARRRRIAGLPFVAVALGKMVVFAVVSLALRILAFAVNHGLRGIYTDFVELD